MYYIYCLENSLTYKLLVNSKSLHCKQSLFFQGIQGFQNCGHSLIVKWSNKAYRRVDFPLYERQLVNSGDETIYFKVFIYFVKGNSNLFNFNFSGEIPALQRGLKNYLKGTWPYFPIIKVEPVKRLELFPILTGFF